jgi:hypothetical protein
MDAADEAAAEDRVGAAVEDGLEQRGQIGRVVFEIGVLDDDDVARGRLDARVPSVEASSTQTSSRSSGTARTRAIDASTVGASLNTGMMTLTRSVAGPISGDSVKVPSFTKFPPFHSG